MLVKSKRTLERPAEERPRARSLDDVRAWLTGPARRLADTLELVDELCWRLHSAGMPLARVIVSLPTLHPQFLNTGYRWSLALGRCEESQIAHGIRETAMFRNSPMQRVFERGERVRRALSGPGAQLDFPVLTELAAEGMTDYVALPFELSDRRRIAITLATAREGGFHEDELETIEPLLLLVVPLLEIHVQRSITRNLLDAYVGPQAGQRVLNGDVVRGQGETIRAVVWFCDLRGFTALSERLPDENVVAFLDAYFERVVSAVISRDGEVLKFLGDGLIAIFPVPDIEFSANAARRACEAARRAIADVDALAGHRSLAGEAVPQVCVSLHMGDVFYGNVGSAERLDFTVIGPAVNLVSRVDQLSKTLRRRVLMTSEFARVCGQKLDPLGSHPIRGVADPVDIFGLREADEALT
jgi:adenylate cyclase